MEKYTNSISNTIQNIQNSISNSIKTIQNSIGNNIIIICVWNYVKLKGIKRENEGKIMKRSNSIIKTIRYGYIYNKIIYNNNIRNIGIKDNIVCKYATDLDLLRGVKTKPIKRLSLYDRNADHLIKCVRKGNYKEADNILKEGVSIDSHNRGENTVLTDAAERGDCNAIKYAISRGANLHSSCDCPYHKTALHYAVENSHYDAVKLLLSLGANPLVLDSRNYKPIDISNDKNVTILLENAMKETKIFLPLSLLTPK